MKKLLSTNEFFVALTLIVLALVIGIMNPTFFSAGNMIDLFRSSIVTGIFAIIVLIVIISGGIDISFPAIAAFAMFSTTKILTSYGYEGSIFLAFLIAGIIGILLGLVNAVLISRFKLPTLIVTLGTASMFSGFLLTFIGYKEIPDVPRGMVDFSKMELFRVTSKTGIVYSLPAAILVLVVIAVVVYFILRYTMLGRGIYALGGDLVSAERAGFNIKKIQFFIYSFVGFLAGIAGVVHTSLMRNSNPMDFMGAEMIVIAAVVLGGARITGGHGTLFGTFLGVFLVLVINNSLILLGIPSYWQKFIVGLLILVGTGITAYQAKRNALKMPSIT
ncbi:ABC transporter permease [Neobacillus sp. KR4-4]|uniref:ABC transporter permease n=1 Tax=Neobacillus sp. KR4-4 TaxID=3344872 RepID=UPI0035CA79FA